MSSWNFESWNEPDHGDFGNLGNITLASYLSYYDATSSGLDDADPRLRFGGPGGSCREPHFVRLCHGLLEHCANAETRARIDFISFHKKGNGSADGVVQGQLAAMTEIASNYPILANLPFYNDEGDPEKSWWKARSWQGDAGYATLVARALIKLNSFMGRSMHLKGKSLFAGHKT